MSKTQEALKMAILQMKAYGFMHLCNYQCDDQELLKVIKICEEALAELALQNMADNAKELGLDYCKHGSDSACKECYMEKAEPVAWMHIHDGEVTEFNDFKACDKCIPLYTHPAPNQLPIPTIAKGRDEIYYAWRKHWAWGIPSKDGEAMFNANADGFQAGWLACEKWIKEKQNDQTK